VIIAPSMRDSSAFKQFGYQVASELDGCFDVRRVEIVPLGMRRLGP